MFFREIFAERLVKRRDFLLSSASLAGGAALAAHRDLLAAPIVTGAPALQPAPQPITRAERLARIEKARRLMRENGIDAMVLEGGTSMFYYTGVRWGNSERTFAVVIPARGELAWVTPGFEEERARELIPNPVDVRAWQEEESPYRLIAGILRDRGATGTIGIEERLRFFIYDGLRSELPQAKFVNATPVTAGCRMFKSPAEIALMQRANDITLAAIGTTISMLKPGMTNNEVSRMYAAEATRRGGRTDGGLVIFGKYTAFPHGSVQPQMLREGDVVLVDAGCTVDGYAADITRTTVFGKPTDRMRQIWDLEKKAQSAAFAAAQVGATCESVDAAARKVITDAGFGPGYKVPGLPHRTGHGIGLDGHEWTNFVKGNTTRLAPGMCFSDEPMIVIYGEFGIRHEDCLYITESGPKFFTPQAPAIDQPV
jgi:Xaa-Pro dipeptidase